jgi:cytochrome c oxidase cbb3-type subunit III
MAIDKKLWTRALLRLAGMTASTALILSLAATSAPAQEHQEQYSPADVATGSRIYFSTCVGCHAPSGAGVGGIDLRHGPLPRASTDAALRTIISNGIPNTGMPASRLGPDDLRGIVAFIRVGFETAPVPVPPGDPIRGRTVFESDGRCLECHRVGDRGSFAGPDLTEIGRTQNPAAIQRALLDPSAAMRPINRPVRAVTRDGREIKGRRLNEDSYTVQLQDENGRLVSLVKAELREWSVITTSPMPPYRDRLSPAALSDLVAYVASLKGVQP